MPILFVHRVDPQQGLAVYRGSVAEAGHNFLNQITHCWNRACSGVLSTKLTTEGYDIWLITNTHLVVIVSLTK